MKTYLIKINRTLGIYGFYPSKLFYGFYGLPGYIRDFIKLKKLRGENREFVFGKIYPILNEKNAQSGNLRNQYFIQDLFFSKIIYQKKPKHHLDIASRIDGFVAQLAVFMEVNVMDIRSQESHDNIKFQQGDLMNLSTDLIGKFDSISSLHAIEHFGLGRYGDPLNYNGHLNAINNIHKMLKKNGTFYFSVPISVTQRIEFNAHRVFSINYLYEILKNLFHIEEFSLLDDDCKLQESIDLKSYDISKFEEELNIKFGLGMFVLTKI